VGMRTRSLRLAGCRAWTTRPVPLDPEQNSQISVQQKRAQQRPGIGLTCLTRNKRNNAQRGAKGKTERRLRLEVQPGVVARWSRGRQQTTCSRRGGPGTGVGFDSSPHPRLQLFLQSLSHGTGFSRSTSDEILASTQRRHLRNPSYSSTIIESIDHPQKARSLYHDSRGTGSEQHHPEREDLWLAHLRSLTIGKLRRLHQTRQNISVYMR
jgi:hypothetical protein